MRIRRLEATKVGRWPSTTLAFAPGLNLVFGPNEAGKSTALRAIEATLFHLGTEELKPLVSPRSPTQFEARVVLERDDAGGVESIAWRRTGKQLQTDEGAPLPPEIQHAWLWETTRVDFRSVYALGGERLRDRHGLLGKGNTLGRILTEMAAGGRDIATVHARFQADLERHYTPRARTKPLLAGALGDVRAATDRMREADVARGHKAYAQAETNARLARELVTQTDATLADRRAALRDLDRLLFAPGGLAEIDALEARTRELAALGPVPDAAWASVTRALRDRGAGVEVELANAERAVADAARALEGLAPSTAVLALEDRIGAVIAARAAQVEAPARHARSTAHLRACATRLETSLVDMGLTTRSADAEGPADLGRFVPPEHTRLALGKAYEALKDAEDTERQLRKAAAEARTRADEERTTLAALGATVEVGPLRALRTETGEPPSPQARQRRGVALAERARELAATAARLGFAADGALDEHRRLRLPAEEPLRALSARYEASTHELRLAETAVRETRASLETTTRDLAERERALPTTAVDADLEAARATRDEAWRAVRVADAAAESAGRRAELLLVYEARTRALDATVDAMLRHADAVAHLAELRRTLDAKRREATLREEALSRARTAQAAILSEWDALWSPLTAARFVAPRIDQTTFARDHAHFLKELDGFLLDEASFAGEAHAQEEARAKLRRALAGAGIDAPADATFGALLARLDDRIADGQAHNAAVAAARALVEKASTEAQRIEDRLEAGARKAAQARAAFEATLAELALPESARDDHEKVRRWIAEGRSLVGQLRELHEAERALAEESVARAERDEQRAEVLSLLAAQGVVIDPASPPLSQTDALATALQRARETRVLEQAYQRAETAREARLRDARDWARAWDDHLRSGGLPPLRPADEDLERCLERSDALAMAARDLARQRGQLEAQANEPIASLRARLGSRSKDDLELAQHALGTELKALEERRNALQRAALEAESAFRALGTLGDHDTLRQDHEAALSVLAEELGETLTLKGAHLLLTKLSEDLAHTNHRAALLARASAYLHRLTGGAFHTVHADDEDATLTVVRAGDDETLGVDALSEGTRDQVFLALRLAVAHGQLADKRLPFVLDDVLVHFDDVRAAAALAALADLAAHTQIILFTHHRHLFDVARDAGVPFHAIELPAPSASDREAAPGAEGAIDAPKPSPRVAKRPRAVVADPAPELLATAPAGAEELFLEKLRELGGSAGNGRLRAALLWDEPVYDEIKAALVASNQVELGKGRGGSVKLVEQLTIL